MNIVKKAIAFGGKYIDYKMAIAGALFLGTVVFLINYFASQNIYGSFTAALKQGTYTFFFGGFIMKTCERLAIGFKNKTKAIFLSVLIPSIIAISLTFLVHSLKGTPHPLESTLPTMLLIVPSTAIWGARKRKRLETRN